MTPEEFYSLPVALQLRRLIEAFPQVAAKAMAGDAPKSPMPPKFDTRIRRKDGFIWASETDASGLRFWITRAEAGGDPKYAEKNQKEAKALRFFLTWREWFPHERWTGERNHRQETANAPSAKPAIQQWEAKPGESSTRKPTTFDDDESSGGEDDYGF